MKHAVKLIAITASATVLSACSSMMPEPRQYVPLKTDPEGAHCLIERGDEVLGEVASTPGNLTIVRTYDPITIRCTKDGFIPVVDIVELKTDPNMVIGMAIGGGPLAAAIGSETLATKVYRHQAIYQMAPSTFPSEQARTDYFEARRSAFISEAEKARDKCRPTKSTRRASPAAEKNCDDEWKAVDDQLAMQLAELEALLAQTSVEASY